MLLLRSNPTPLSCCYKPPAPLWVVAVGDDDVGIMMMMMAGGVWWWRGFGGGDGGVIRRVEESGVGDRVDRVTRNDFGLRRKSPPEKFSGGGEWWPAAGELAGEERWEREIC
ncbi:hypothetical protein Tco_0953820 [Tanacetum coccineum]|uniref:Uncharacterized protein n=1 Tax=Tanacetum coccineum TaxID=301880 RepID=A0ABQ5E0Z3_9ASTR